MTSVKKYLNKYFMEMDYKWKAKIPNGITFLKPVYGNAFSDGLVGA
jgi:hypothetical protein